MTGRKRMQLGVIALGIALALIGAILAARDRSIDDPTAASEVFLEATDDAGANPFMESVEITAPAPERPTTTTTATTTSTTTAPPMTAPDVALASFAGDTPGLYGGTREARSCDKQKLVAFLEDHPAEAAAWAGVLGIEPHQIRSYVAPLTPVLLRRDTRVTNHGFENGRATVIPAVLQAGTAVLVDEFGRPVVKCFCGNPLTTPVEVERVVYVGDPWPEFSPVNITVVVPTPVVINVFVLVDVHTNRAFTRPAGTTGAQDADATDQPVSTTTTGPKTTTTTTGPARDARDYTVEFQGVVTGPCGWPTGTGSMTVRPDGDGIAITLTYPSGAKREYRGSLDENTGAFATPDAQYGRNPLTGTFVFADGGWDVPDGRLNTQNANGDACIGGFTARWRP